MRTQYTVLFACALGACGGDGGATPATRATRASDLPAPQIEPSVPTPPAVTAPTCSARAELPAAAARVAIYPEPRSIRIAGLGAQVERVCLDASAAAEPARVEAWAAELIRAAKLTWAGPDPCVCEWSLRVTTTAEPDRYVAETATVGGRAQTTISAATSRAVLWGLRAAFAGFDEGSRRVATATIDDAPSFAHRGVLESYYGTPYTKDERRTLIRLASQVRHDTYIYGPKLDSYTRSLWALPYPAERADAIRDAALEAERGGIDFVWAASPGLTYDFARHSSELPRLVTKIESVRALGVKRFALFLDDILNFDAEAHVRLMNDVDDHLHRVDPSAHLIVVGWSYAILPTPYTDVLGAKLHPGVEVLWTGPGIYSPSMSAADMADINRSVRRQVSVWDNWPQSPQPLTGRSADLPTATHAFYSNPVVNEWDARPVRAFFETLGPLADYAWNAPRYAATSAAPVASRARWLDLLADLAP